MERPQESKPESKKNEGGEAAKKGGGAVLKLLGQAHTMLLGAGAGAGLVVGGAGCGGAGPETSKPLPLDVRVTMVTPVEKPRPLDGGAGGGEAKKKKEDVEHWKEARFSVIGGHVLSDGKYYLKTVEVEGKKRIAVWELIEGDIPTAIKPPSRVTARIDEKDGRLDFDGHIYFAARDPGAWERGYRGKGEEGRSGKKAADPLPTPEKMKTMKKIEEIPPEIRTLLGENAVRLQHPVTVQYGRDIFLVDGDGRRLWKFVAGDVYFLLRGTVDRPFISGGVVYGTRAMVKYGEETKEQITTHDMRVGPNGQPFVDRNFMRVWQLADVTLDKLKTRVADDAARARVAASEQIEQKKREMVQEQGLFLKIVRISGKTFEDSRGAVWTHAAGYFPSLSPGMIYGAKVRVENPQWERNPHGAGHSLVGGTQILRWRIDGRGDVEFRAPVERKK